MENNMHGHEARRARRKDHDRAMQQETKNTNDFTEAATTRRANHVVLGDMHFLHMVNGMSPRHVAP